MASHAATNAASAASSASDDPALTAIVAAMEEEVVGLRVRLIGAQTASVGEARVTLGRLGGARVALAVTGDGERNARRGLAALLAAHPGIGRIIVVGVAGGLSANLEAGALIIGERVVDEADGSVYTADATLVDAAARGSGARRGIAVSAARIADTVDEKRRLLAMAMTIANATATADAPTGAGDGGGDGDEPLALSAVVDLESSAFAAAATRAGIPWVVLRAISDTASDSVPALLNRSRDDGGAVRRGSVVRGLLTNPGALLPLLALRERVRACAGSLAHATGLTMAALRTLDAPVAPAPAGAHARATAASATGLGRNPQPANTPPRVQRDLNGA